MDSLSTPEQIPSSYTGKIRHHIQKKLENILAKLPSQKIKSLQATINSKDKLIATLTAEKAEEQQMRKRLEEFNNTIEAVLFAIDLDSRFSYSNQAHTNHTGKKDPQDIIGHTAYEILNTDPASIKELEEENNNNWEQHFQSGEPLVQIQEHPTLDKSGNKQISYFKTTKIAVEKEGKRLRYGSSINDTDAVLSHKEIASANEEFKTLNEKLYESKELRNKIASILSHDIKIPMDNSENLIEKILISLKENTFNKEKSIHRLSIIGEKMEYMSKLLESTLEFGKLKSGIIKPQEDLFNLQDLFTKTIEGINLFDNTIVLDPSLQQLPQKVLGDITRLRQVLTNLLSNAAKFTPRGTITISGTTQDMGPNILYTITVADSGEGMDAQKLEKLFTPYETTEPKILATSHHKKGHGLGLVISKELAQILGGDLTATSAGPGQGSQFHFSFSCKKIAHV